MSPEKTSKTQHLPSIRDLVDAGAHFGHRRSRTNPKAKQFTYLMRDRVYVIDLGKTQEYLAAAAQAAEGLAKDGKTFVFVGTKPQAAEAVKAAAEAAGMPYVNHRWLGGTLTNFETIRSNLELMSRLESLVETDSFEQFTKKERGRITKQLAKLRKTFTGIKDLTRVPDAMVVVDVTEEDIAVMEANRLGLTLFGVVDTNANPEVVTHPIPANDDSRKTIELILGVLAEAITRGKAQAPVAAPADDTITVTGSDRTKPAETKAERMAEATGDPESATKPAKKTKKVADTK